MEILVLNKVSKEGLAIFGDEYFSTVDGDNPDAIIVRSAKVDTDEYAGLLAVARAGAGVNNITVESATKRGICVFNTPGANANAVAELVFVMLGYYARKIGPAIGFVKTLAGTDAEITASVEAGKSKFTGFELARKTLGVIGLGKIGLLVANAGIERGMKVIGFDAFPTLENMHQLDSRVEVARCIEDIFAVADILSVHVPLTESTKNMIGAPQIVLMKHGCVVINYARSGIYDNSAVLNAIDSGRVEVYITDFSTTALLGNSRVICTPHLGASTDEAEENCAVMACRQLKNFLEFGTVTNSVNFPTLEVGISPAVLTRLAIVNNDVPNMISAITGIIGGAGLNIHNFTNKGNGKIGYSLVDLDVCVTEFLIDKIRKLPNVLCVRVLRFTK